MYNFTFIVPDLSGGGAEKAIVNLSQSLAARSHKVRLILLRNKKDYDLPVGVDVNILCNVEEGLGRGWWGKRKLATRLKRFCKKKPLGLVVSTLPFADEVVHLARLPNHHCRIANTLSVEVEKLKTKGKYKATRRYSRYRKIYTAHPLIAVSDGVKEDLESYFKLTTEILSIPNGYNLAEIRKLASEPLTAGPAEFVLHVGRFSQQKRHDLLLDAWAQIDTDKKLVLLVSSEAQLTKMIADRRLQDRVIVAGFQSNPYKWMKNASLLVLCSDHEGLPNVLLESLICGTGVVATDCPSGPKQILKGAPECLVPMGDRQALATTISTQLQHPTSLAAIDLSVYMMDQVCEVYEQLASKVAS